VALTAIMMVGEIMAGWLSGSIALLADGWHMATYAVALGIAGLAYLNPPPEAVIHTKRTSRFGEPSCNRTETSDRRFESVARADRHHRVERARQDNFVSGNSRFRRASHPSARPRRSVGCLGTRLREVSFKPS
jgi:hypothetical protein